MQDMNAAPSNDAPKKEEAPKDAVQPDVAMAAVPAPAKEEPKHDAPKHDMPAHDAAPADPNRRRNILAALSYIGILFLVPLLMDHKDEFVQFHLRQGLVTFALGVIASVGFLSRGFGGLLEVVVVIVSVFGAFKALTGQKWVLPLLGHYAAKIRL